MNTHWLNELRDELARLEADDQLRELRAVDDVNLRKQGHGLGQGHQRNDAFEGKWIERDGERLLNFAGNDYLALTHHPNLKAAAKEAIDRFGTGSGASRLVTGHSSQVAQLESQFAAFKHADAALLFPTGYMANLAVLTALPRKHDVILIDKLCHASLIDGARASDATVRSFPHLKYDRLETLLSRYRRSNTASHPQVFIVTDSVFSMDGDVADLVRLTQLAEQFNAVLVVDEAHATGLFGETRAGMCEAQGVSEQVDMVISTASKALGSLGGIVTGARAAIDTLINRARSLIYTTAPPPAQVATIAAAMDVLQDEPDRGQRVLNMSKELPERLREASAKNGIEIPVKAWPTPIIPLITGSSESALQLAGHLEKQGICAPAIRPPTVAPNRARVRITLRADLNADDLNRLFHALQSFSIRD